MIQRKPAETYREEEWGRLPRLGGFLETKEKSVCDIDTINAGRKMII